jgi:hypothetical protein
VKTTRNTRGMTAEGNDFFAFEYFNPQRSNVSKITARG